MIKNIFNKLLIAALFAFTITSCSNETQQSNEQAQSKDGNTTISGELQNASNTTIILEKLTAQNTEFVDSIKVDEEGVFSNSVNIEYPTFYRLRVSNTSFVNIVVAEGDNLKITGDANTLNTNHKVEGSEEAKLYKEFGDKMAYFYTKRDSVNKLIPQYQANNNQEAITQAQQFFIQMQQDFVDFNHRFISEHAGTMASLAAVSNLPAETELKYYKMVDEAMAAKMPNSPYYQQLHQTVQASNNLSIGSEAPDIVSTKPDGSTQSLADLKGKVVLVDFWASWCGPCRRENPNVVAAYKKFKDKGFTVLSVSLDGMPKQGNARQDWLNAIEQDGLLWDNHVSDLKGWNSAVVPAYKIQGIPLTVLVDKEGKILAKNLRGQALEQKLSEVLGA